jgi:hypothetical protein
MVRALLFELSRRSGEISAAKPTLIPGWAILSALISNRLLG